MKASRAIAGIFCGVGALLLIWRGNITEACTILGGMLGFFVGEANGYRNAKKEKED